GLGGELGLVAELGQRHADHSCRAAVARLLAHRSSRGEIPCSAHTGTDCQARDGFPEKFFADVAWQAGPAVEVNVDPQWLWRGRRVHVYNGSPVSMPNTSENQASRRRGRRNRFCERVNRRWVLGCIKVCSL